MQTDDTLQDIFAETIQVLREFRVSLKQFQLAVDELGNEIGKVADKLGHIEMGLIH